MPGVSMPIGRQRTLLQSDAQWTRFSHFDIPLRSHLPHVYPLPQMMRLLYLSWSEYLLCRHQHRRQLHELSMWNGVDRHSRARAMLAYAMLLTLSFSLASLACLAPFSLGAAVRIEH